MSDNYKPTVEVVRQHQFSSEAWMQEDGRYPDSERAVLARGLPEVGERVTIEDRPGVVLGYAVYVKVEDEKTGLCLSHPAHWLRPDTRDAEVGSEVETVAKALYADISETGAEDWDDLTDFHRDIWRRDARNAIEALDKVRGRDE